LFVMGVTDLLTSHGATRCMPLLLAIDPTGEELLRVEAVLRILSWTTVEDTVPTSLVDSCMYVGGTVVPVGIPFFNADLEGVQLVLRFLNVVEVGLGLTFDEGPILCDAVVKVPSSLGVCVREDGSLFLDDAEGRVDWSATSKQSAPSDVLVRERKVVEERLTMEYTDYKKLWQSRPLQRVAEARYYQLLCLYRFFPPYVVRCICYFFPWRILPRYQIVSSQRVDPLLTSQVSLCVHVAWVPVEIGVEEKPPDGYDYRSRSQHWISPTRRDVGKGVFDPRIVYGDSNFFGKDNPAYWTPLVVQRMLGAVYD